MTTILVPTSAEVVAARYLWQRDKALHGLVVAQEAIDRLHDVARGKRGANPVEIAHIINRAQSIIEEGLLLGGYYEEGPDI